ncbi:DUF1840 domain-containing protein [Methylobacillus flagellatus]|uniref:DUF1840 domain-containing protein n=1 Tax=Methylobacillus flagellatus TaxID=405 RepID=UPI002853AE76|nr:DUF1840 domain-containing protein [Methylobacillus flagellatus]MDR5171170.1 DUF1840 domain-containing protein [Methylobacillus flagellatus]
MLVTFSTARYSDIMLFGDVAKQLLQLMGHSGTIPGAILAADVPRALQHLQQGLEGAAAPDNPESPDTEDEAVHVSLKKRALPLIELLQSAIQNQSDVMWK